MNGYVIWLSTELENSNHFNEYGYWEGKTYVVQGEPFPRCDTSITNETKIYKSRVRAEKMAQKLYDRCAWVLSWKIKEVGKDDESGNESATHKCPGG